MSFDEVGDYLFFGLDTNADVADSISTLSNVGKRVGRINSSPLDGRLNVNTADIIFNSSREVNQ